MENWKDSRNYRRVKDENGRTAANIITVDGVDVEVSEEVFRAYSQMDRRERYLEEDMESGRQLSLEQLSENHILPEHLGAQIGLSIEEQHVQQEELEHQEELLRRLGRLLHNLNEEDRALIHALYFERLPVREYARRLGVYHRTITYRRDRLLKNLRKNLS